MAFEAALTFIKSMSWAIGAFVALVMFFYGIKLFERLSKKLYITESGALLLKYARHIVQSFDEMEMELKNTGQSIRLRVGATITVGTCMLNKIIDDFEKSNKDIGTKITINNTNVIEKMLLNS